MTQQSKTTHGVSQQRQFAGWGRRVVSAIAVIGCLYALAWGSGILRQIGIQITSSEHRGAILAMILTLTFILYPMTKKAPRDRLPWYDYIFILAGLAGGGYFLFFYETVQDIKLTGLATPAQQALALVAILAVLEATRRALGTPMVLVAAFFFLHTFFSNYFPGFMYARGYSLARVTTYVYFGPEGLFGVPLGVAATIIIVFLIFGALLILSGGGKFYIDLALALLGHIRGGPAKAAVIGSALMGTVTSAATANIATVGVLTIPMMKSVGYKPHFAAAVEAVSSNGSHIMPPVMGVVAFIIADWLGISYWEVCVASALPAILYYAALFFAVDLEAGKRNLARVPRAELPPLKKTLAEGWYFFLPIAALVVFMAVFDFSPERSGMYATVIVIILSLFRKETRLGPKKIAQALENSARGFLSAGLACATAGILIGSISLTGIGINLSNLLVKFGGGNVALLLLLTAATSFVLGMGLTSVPCYIMLAVTVAPALVKLGVLPIAAHLFVYYWGIVSYITPPVAIAAFVAAAVAGCDPMRTAITATRLGIVTFIIPFMFIYSPVLLLKGPPAEIALAALSSLIGCAALAAGTTGYLLKDASWVQRILLMAAALLLLIPGWETDLIGAALVAVVLLWQIYKMRATRATAPVKGS